MEPGGDSPYRKSIYDSLHLGCIPVVFSEYMNRVAPWHWGPFRDQTRVYVDEQAYLDGRLDIFNYLQNIPRADVINMQLAIEKYAHRLMYALDDVPRDAVENILTAAWQHALRRESHEGTRSSKPYAPGLSEPHHIDAVHNIIVTSKDTLRSDRR